jgi:dipeptidyl aminopeptidase/acylaminoacyl peptidase
METTMFSQTQRQLFVIVPLLAAFITIFWLPSLAVRASVPLALDDALRFRQFADLTAISLSPDLNWVAFTVRENRRARTVDDRTWALTGIRDIFTGTDVYILNLRSGATRRLTEGQFDNFQTVWSPNSRYLAFISDRDGSNQAKVWVWDAVREDTRKVGDLSVRQLGLIAWTPDSRKIIAPVLPEGISAERYAKELTSGSAERVEPRSTEVAGSTVEVFRANVGGTISRSVEGTDPWSLNIFLRDLALIDVEDGRTTIVARGKIAGYGISPDGSKIAYSVPKRFERPGSQQTLFDLLTSALDGSHKQLLASDARLDYDGASFNWSPDSKHIAYYAFREGGLETDTADYYVVDATGGTPQDVTHSVPEQRLPARSTAPLWDSSGEHIYFIRNGALWVAGTHIESSELSNIPGRQILKLIPRSQGSLWTPQTNSTIAVTSDRTGKQDGFFRVDLATGQSTKLLEAGQCYSCANMDQQFQVTKDGKAVAYLAEDAENSPDLFLSDPNFSQPHKLTHLNPQYDKVKMGAARLISWLSNDGEPLHGALLLPSSYNPEKHYPLIVWVYGGKNRSDHFDQFGFEGQGPFNLQLLATRGYAVLLPDAPQHVGTPMLDLLKTVLPGVNKVIELGIADPERLGVMGHSYGGYSTLCLITQTNRFRAAVEADGEADLLAGYGGMDDRGTSYGIALEEEGQGAMGGTPWQFRDRYIENSPVFHLDRVETPLLIVHGGEDTAIRPFLGDEVFVDLRRLGKQVEYAKYLDEEHSPLAWSYGNQLDFCQRMIEWFNDHLMVVDRQRRTTE